MSPRRWAIVIAAAVLVPAAGWASWRFLRPVEVAVATVQRGAVATQVEGPGTVQARVPLTVSARLTSTIVEVRADVGDAVREGQVLVVLDARDLAARRTAVQRQQESIARQVEAADAAVAKARADLVLASARVRRDGRCAYSGRTIVQGEAVFRPTGRPRPANHLAMIAADAIAALDA